MKSKQLVMVLVTLAVVFATAGHAFADCQKRFDLSPTGAGTAINASADARVRQVGARQKFTVELDADVANGTTFTVSVTNSSPAPNGQSGTAGTITIKLGNGTLSVDNANGAVLPTGVDPVCTITRVDVTDSAGHLVLTGSF